MLNINTKNPPVIASTFGFDTSKSYPDMREPVEQIYLPDALDQSSTIKIRAACLNRS
jgi:hypothetical protein